jgi:hypothetical protein
MHRRDMWARADRERHGSGRDRRDDAAHGGGQQPSVVGGQPPGARLCQLLAAPESIPQLTRGEMPVEELR